MAKNTASKPIATGKLKVISGIRLPRTDLAALSEESPLVDSSLPQTRQRVASSFNLVPQVGQSFEGWVFSGLIGIFGVARRLGYKRGDYTSLFQALRIHLFPELQWYTPCDDAVQHLHPHPLLPETLPLL